MTLAEKRLYHQVHPAKLVTDISAEIISAYLFWKYQLGIGLLLHILPSIVASLLVIRYADLERIKRSHLGHYLRQHMTPPVEAARIVGDIIIAVGAWYHLLWAIAGGLLVILAAWLNGLLIRSKA